MSDAARLRLGVLLGPLLHHLPPHERAEATRLLGPGTFVWPPEGPPWSAPVSREEFVANCRTADAMPLGVEWHTRTDQF